MGPPHNDMEGATVALDSRHWRDRANEARSQAELLHNDTTRRIMLRLAADYDNLADRAEAKEASGLPPQPASRASTASTRAP
jgi:hypothetical protein